MYKEKEAIDVPIWSLKDIFNECMLYVLGRNEESGIMT
jgi:hypothetical protein